jgi:hypothetical protein
MQVLSGFKRRAGIRRAALSPGVIMVLAPGYHFIFHNWDKSLRAYN